MNASWDKWLKTTNAWMHALVFMLMLPLLIQLKRRNCKRRKIFWISKRNMSHTRTTSWKIWDLLIRKYIFDKQFRKNFLYGRVLFWSAFLLFPSWNPFWNVNVFSMYARKHTQLKNFRRWISIVTMSQTNYFTNFNLYNFLNYVPNFDTFLR